MKTYNTYFENIDNLKLFLIQNNIVDDKKILIQIFTGICDAKYISNLIKDINSILPNAKIIGSTTDGEILEDKISHKKTVLSISTFTNTQIITYATNIKKSSYDTANSLINKLKKIDDLKLIITFCDGMTINGQEYVKAFEDFKNSLVIAGGLAGDNGEFNNTYVFTENGIVENGAVLAAFYNKNLIVNSDFNFNWESIGKILTVTNAKDNIIYTIDDMPAAKMYEKYLGSDIHNKLPSNGIEFPLIIKKNGINIARAVITKFDDDSLMFGGNITKGEKVQLGFGNVETIINNRFEIANRILKQPCESIFIYSCTARKRVLDSFAELEIQPLSNIAPSSGFFTYGEIFHNKLTRKNEFLNHTLTALFISETETIKSQINIKRVDKEPKETNTIKALCHLTSIASRELNELNHNLTKTIDEKTYELRVKNKELLQRYYYDELTTLGNRNLLLKDISNSPENYSLVSIDINHFQNVNDLYGTSNGDDILKQFAKLLIKTKPHPYCRIFRVSGDEFAILNKKPQNDKYENLVKYLNKAVDENEFFMYFSGEKISIYLTITIGIAYKTKKLIEKAHLALNQAKKERVSYKMYISDLKLEKDIIRNMNLTKIIKDAIKEDRVIAFFQPIFIDDKIHKYETLMRIEHQGKIILPFEFLSIAKKNGDYFDLTKIIINKSFEIFSKKDTKFSINLSFEDIASQKIVSYLKEKIQHYQVSHKLIIEILEDESIKNYTLVKDFIYDFKKMGVEIALDDFGSGYSNFSRVLELNVDYIKIDGSIISKIDTNKDSYLIAQTITEFAKKLGIKTIAEYIHSQDVYEKAKELGIDEFQGFLLAEPKPLT